MVNEIARARLNVRITDAFLLYKGALKALVKLF